MAIRRLMVITVLLGCLGTIPLRADEPAARLVGTWKLVEARYGGRESDLPSQWKTLKHITPTHAIWVSYDAAGAMIRSAGGPYRSDGATLRSTPEFGMGPDFDAIRGREQTYRITLDGNRFRQVGTLGDGTTLDEVWERVEGDKVANLEPPRRPIDAAQAVALAEQFVRANGYTDFVPPDPSKLASESIEHLDPEQWAAHRHNTLKPRAVGYLASGKMEAPGWTIAFDHAKPANDRESGRAVTMDEFGGQLRVEHKDLWLTNPALRAR